MRRVAHPNRKRWWVVSALLFVGWLMVLSNWRQTMPIVGEADGVAVSNEQPSSVSYASRTRSAVILVAVSTMEDIALLQAATSVGDTQRNVHWVALALQYPGTTPEQYDELIREVKRIGKAEPLPCGSPPAALASLADVSGIRCVSSLLASPSWSVFDDVVFVNSMRVDYSAAGAIEAVLRSVQVDSVSGGVYMPFADPEGGAGIGSALRGALRHAAPLPSTRDTRSNPNAAAESPLRKNITARAAACAAATSLRVDGVPLAHMFVGALSSVRRFFVELLEGYRMLDEGTHVSSAVVAACASASFDGCCVPLAPSLLTYEGFTCDGRSKRSQLHGVVLDGCRSAFDASAHQVDRKIHRAADQLGQPNDRGVGELVVDACVRRTLLLPSIGEHPVLSGWHAFEQEEYKRSRGEAPIDQRISRALRKRRRDYWERIKYSTEKHFLDVSTDAVLSMVGAYPPSTVRPMVASFLRSRQLTSRLVLFVAKETEEWTQFLATVDRNAVVSVWMSEFEHLVKLNACAAAEKRADTMSVWLAQQRDAQKFFRFVMCVDSRDTVFQRDPFEGVARAQATGHLTGHFLAAPIERYALPERSWLKEAVFLWNSAWVTDVFGEAFFQDLAQRRRRVSVLTHGPSVVDYALPVVNSGMYIGDGESVLHLLESMAVVPISMDNLCVADQGTLNGLVLSGLLLGSKEQQQEANVTTSMWLISPYTAVFTHAFRSMDEVQWKDDTLVNCNGAPYAAVHQSDWHPAVWDRLTATTMP